MAKKIRNKPIDKDLVMSKKGPAVVKNVQKKIPRSTTKLSKNKSIVGSELSNKSINDKLNTKTITNPLSIQEKLLTIPEVVVKKVRNKTQRKSEKKDIKKSIKKSTKLTNIKTTPNSKTSEKSISDKVESKAMGNTL